MQWLLDRRLWLASFLLALGWMLPGCGGDGMNGKPFRPRDSAGGGKERTPVALKKGEYATLKGHVTLTAGKEKLTTLTNTLQKQMRGNAQEAPHCIDALTGFQIEQQLYYVGGEDDNRVGFVFVWVEPESSDQFFPITDEQLQKHNQDVVIHQPHCAFIPHCAVVFSAYPDPSNPKKRKKTQQQLIVKNDATFGHNTAVAGDRGNESAFSNQSLPPGTDTGEINLKPSSAEVKVTCGIHPWMNARVRAFEHPFATLSKVPLKEDPTRGWILNKKDKTFGTFNLKVPAGVKLRLYAWHERAGYLARGEMIGPLEKDSEMTKEFSMQVVD